MDKTNTVMAEIVDGVDHMCLCFLPALKFCFGDFLHGVRVMCLLKVDNHSPGRPCPPFVCPPHFALLLLPSTLWGLGANGFASMRAELVLCYFIP